MIKNIPDDVINTIKTIQDEGKEAYLVGGCLRDGLLGLPPKDYDIVTSALPGELIDIFSNQPKNRILLTGLKHGTITLLKNKQPIEITTYIAYDKTIGGTLESDLARRDFTINAIAYDPINNIINDPHDGINDLKGDTIKIKAVENGRLRFTEDPVRILRAYYMMAIAEKANKMWDIDAETANAVIELKHMLCDEAVERQRDVLFKILTSPTPRKILETMAEHGVLFEIIPEMAPMAYLEQNEHHTQNVLQHTFSVVENTQDDITTRMAALLHDIGKPISISQDEKNGTIHFYEHEKIGSPIAKTILNRLKCTREMQSQVITLIESHMRPAPKSQYQARQQILSIGENLIDKHIDLRNADIADQNFRDEKKKDIEVGTEIIRQELKNDSFVKSLKDLAVSGADINELYKEKQGAIIGKTLAHLFQLTTAHPEINNREQLLSIASKYIEKNFGIPPAVKLPDFSGRWFMTITDASQGIATISRTPSSLAVKIQTKKVIDGSENESLTFEDFQKVVGIKCGNRSIPPDSMQSFKQWILNAEIQSQLPHDVLYRIGDNEYVTLNFHATTKSKPIYIMTAEEYKNTYNIQDNECNWHGTSGISNTYTNDRVFDIISNGFSTKFDGVTYCTIDKELAQEHASMMAKEREESPVLLPVYILNNYEPLSESGMDSDAFPSQGLVVEHEFAIKYAFERGIYRDLIATEEIDVSKVEKICATYGLDFNKDGISNNIDDFEYDSSNFI